MHSCLPLKCVCRAEPAAQWATTTNKMKRQCSKIPNLAMQKPCDSQIGAVAENLHWIISTFHTGLKHIALCLTSNYTLYNGKFKLLYQYNMIWEVQRRITFHFGTKKGAQCIEHGIAFTQANIKYFWVLGYLEEAYIMPK